MAAYSEALRRFALAFEGAWEDHPWGEESIAYKTAKGKIFAMCGQAGAGFGVTMKLAPDEGDAALALPFVRRADYVGRFGWVTAEVSSDFEFETALGWVARSFELVSPKRRKAAR